jgi:hypothetical protein
MAMVNANLSVPCVEHFQAKWTPVRVKKMRLDEKLLLFSVLPTPHSTEKFKARLPDRPLFAVTPGTQTISRAGT